MTETSQPAERVAPGDRIAGAALIAGAAVSVFAMAHHPTSADSGAIGPIVHGAMIAVLGAMAFGFFTLCLRRGPARPATLAGAIAFGFSLFANIGAATTNGFVVPALAARGGGVVSPDIFRFAWESNQALAGLGVFALGLAFIFWSLDFLRRPGAEPRLIGALGLLAGAIPIALLVTGAISMNVAGAAMVYAGHAAWTALVGLHLWRGKVE